MPLPQPWAPDSAYSVNSHKYPQNKSGREREWLNFLGLFIVCWADTPGVIYLPTIKNIYESVSAVCSKQETINLPVHPRSPPLLALPLSSCLHLAISLTASPRSHFSLFFFLAVALITWVSARSHKDLPSISNSSAPIGFFWGVGWWWWGRENALFDLVFLLKLRSGNTFQN